MAIVLDNTSSGIHGSTPGTVQHVVSAGLTNSILITTVSVQDSNHANIVVGSITYGTQVMTIVRQDTSNTNNVSAVHAYLLNPTAGTALVSVYSAGVVTKLIINSSWQGVKQSGQPDAQVGQGTANQNSTVAAGTITTVAANSLVIQTISSEANISSIKSNQTFVGVGTLQGQSFENVCVSYVMQTSAGLGTMAGTLSSGAAWNENVVSYSPFVAVGGAAIAEWRSLMGVGQ